MKNIDCYLFLVVLSLSVSLSSFAQSTEGASSGSTSGATSGAQDGATTGGHDGSGDVHCEYVMSGVLSSSHTCTRYCKKNWLSGKETTERTKCRECIEKYSTENGGDLVVDWTQIPGGRPNKSTVVIGGVRVKKDKMVNIVRKPGHDLEDCVKEDDGQKISCPDGVYVKTGSVVNSMRSPAVEGRGDLPKKNKVQKNQGSANEQ